MIEKYYRISTGHNNKTPYAPTILSNNDVYLSNCPICGRTRFNHSNKDLTLLIEGKGVLPDFLLCGHYPLKIVSDKVLKVWENSGITGFTSFPVKLVGTQNDETRLKMQYHNIIVTGKAELDFGKMGVEITNICNGCGSVDYNKPNWEFDEAIMKEKTYGNSDLFTFKYFEAAPLCTLNVLETVYKNKLSSFRFNCFESMFMYPDPNPDINLKKLFK